MKLISKIAFIGMVTAISFASCKKEKQTQPSPVSQKQKPVANAGEDRVFTTAPDSINLDGSASTDADGNIHSYVWTVISGPFDLVITNQLAVTATAKKNQAGILQGGVYEFQLTVTDNDGLSSTDRVIFTVPDRPVIARVLEYGTDIPIEGALVHLSRSINFEWPYAWADLDFISGVDGKIVFPAEKYMVGSATVSNYWDYDIRNFNGDNPSLVFNSIHTADSFSIWKIPQTMITVHVQNSGASTAEDVFFYSHGNATSGWPGDFIYLRPGIDTTFQYMVCGNMDNTFSVAQYDYFFDNYVFLHQSSLYVPKQNNLTLTIIY